MTTHLFPFEGYFCSLTRKGTKQYFESVTQAARLIVKTTGRPFDIVYPELLECFHSDGGVLYGYFLTPNDYKACTRAKQKARRRRNKALRELAEKNHLQTLSYPRVVIYHVRKDLFNAIKHLIIPETLSDKQVAKLLTLSPWELKKHNFQAALSPWIKKIDPSPDCSTL